VRGKGNRAPTPPPPPQVSPCRPDVGGPLGPVTCGDGRPAEPGAVRFSLALDAAARALPVAVTSVAGVPLLVPASACEGVRAPAASCTPRHAGYSRAGGRASPRPGPSCLRHARPQVNLR